MLNDFFLLLLDNIRQTTWIEAIAAVTGIVSIWLGRKANVLIFPVGIVSVLLYVHICYNARLYADMGVNFVYFIMSIYGWYNWLRPHKESKSDRLPITFQGSKQRRISIGLALLMFVALAFLLSHCTDSDVPVIDAFTTALCVMAMYLTTQKKSGKLGLLYHRRFYQHSVVHLQRIGFHQLTVHCFSHHRDHRIEIVAQGGVAT